MITCDEIKKNIANDLGERFECVPLPGCLVINTPFTYPNLDSIQVFIETLPNGDVVISDKGETLRYLASYQIDPEDSDNRANAIKSVVSSFDTEFSKGVFSKQSRDGEFSGDLLDLVNTLMRVGDLQLVQKVRKPRGDFYREVERLVRVIAPGRESLELRKPVEGNSGKKYHATYFIKSANAVIEPLPNPAHSGDSAKFALVFQEFYDLKHKADMGYNLYAILDDEENEWPDEQKILLSDVARILPWSRRGQWKGKLLKAA